MPTSPEPSGEPAFTIRLLGPDDLGLLRDAHPDAFDHAIDEAEAAALLASPQQCLAGALVEGRLVGMATAVVYRRPDQPPACYLDEVGVADAYQRRGIGSALVRAVADWARGAGCDQAWLMTEADNAPARALYAYLGGAEEQRPVYITFGLSAPPA